MGVHSVFGPSSSSGWLNCPGKIKAEEGIPDEESSFAAEGTKAHFLAEQALKQGITVQKLVETTDQGVVDQEMIDFTQEYVSYVVALGGEQEYEQEISYDDIIPGGFGTVDAIAVVDKTVFIADLKYGKGVPVFAEDNPQAMLYGLSVIAERWYQKFDKVVLVIHQPRLNNVSTWETTPKALYEFGQYARERAKLCLKPNPPRTPGEKQCRWCRAKATCMSLQTQTEHALMVQFEDLTVDSPKAPEELSDQDLLFVMNHKGMIETWLKAVEKHVMGKIESGRGFPGYKIVAGRSNRKWSDEKEAATLLKKLLGEEAYVKKLLTAPAAEKALGKEDKYRIQELIVKPEGKAVLVPEADKRPALSAVTAEDFDIIS